MTCRYPGCKGKIKFAKSPNGKRNMAFDAKPFPRADLAEGGWAIVDGKAERAGPLFGEPLRYVDHHATCAGLIQGRDLERLEKRNPVLAARVKENQT